MIALQVGPAHAWPPADVVVVKEIPGVELSAPFVDRLSAQFERMNDRPMDVSQVRLVGPAWRLTLSGPVPLPEVDHPVVNATVQWLFDVDGTTLSLTVSRLDVGGPVPEAERIAATVVPDEPAPEI